MSTCLLCLLKYYILYGNNNYLIYNQYIFICYEKIGRLVDTPINTGFLTFL